MNDQFDELAKGLALSVTRRQALRRFGAGITGVVLARLGLSKAEAAKQCQSDSDCGMREICTTDGRCYKCSNCHEPPPYWGCPPLDARCVAYCRAMCA